MKISLINGSQKLGESNSGIILDSLNNLIEENHEIKMYRPCIKPFNDEMFKDVISTDVIVLAFPLYVDSIPSYTLEMLVKLENIIKTEQTKGLMVYAIINNGFYEGKQNAIAFEIIKHWCEHCQIQFGGGIGQGAGEMLGATKNMPLSKGPFNNLFRTLKTMSEKISLKESFDVIYLNPYFPRFLYKFYGEKGWHTLAAKNGVKKKDIKKML